ncbi:ATP-binding protein [Fortiea contorta]|uniref:ATP-binding protein n=1 Tax=Fortiea contorta TaxID=1892405 RepID=UPI000349C9D0|nr:ATP-binding protein [Fortiea contorta]
MSQFQDPTTPTTSHPHQEYLPIHLSGAIQPHGVMLVLDIQLQIWHISNNTEAYLGKCPQDLLGKSLECLLGEQQMRAIADFLIQEIGSVYCLKVSINIHNQVQYFDCIVHRTPDVVIVELEPTKAIAPLSFLQFQAIVGGAIAKMQSITHLPEFLQLAAAELRAITGFDRVIVYQFDQQGAGAVIAEAKTAELPSYLHLHYPATDIPEQSRELYRRCALRFIPNLTAPPVMLVPAAPVDLSLSVLRSVDPCCVEFHHNMGVEAMMVISLMKEGQLWGLISCHHQTPKHLPYEVRKMCEFLAQMISAELAHKVNHWEWDYEVKLKALQADLLKSISHADNFIDALIKPEIRLLDLVGATGAAVCLDGEITLVGTTPDAEAVRKLMMWADTQVSDNLFSTDSLPQLYSQALTFKDVASGLLLLRISQVRRYYILWFRPEVLQTLNWAGNPQPSLRVGADDNIILRPRTSFAKWQETVVLTSLSWKPCELDSALALRNAIVGIVLKAVDELAQINRELERSNQELAAFAYAASHDLKEPLRGIYNFSTVLLEDYAHVLGDEGVEYLETVLSLSQRMETLINAVLRLSQLGQAQLCFQPTDLNPLLDQVIDVFRASRPESRFHILVPRPLPTIVCHSVLINEVFSNLLGNAGKYNDQAQPEIEIGYLDSATSSGIFYVRDNGIGIQQHHLETIFRLFKRLHSQEKYGGGTGAGLAIVKKIVELHNGRIWVESTLGVGSIFYFTLE